MASVVRSPSTSGSSQEEALRSSEERFRLLVDGVSDYAICMLDPGGLVTMWNRGAERITGYAESEIVGRSFSLLFPPEDVRAGRPERELLRAREEGRFEEESFRVRKDGTRFWAGVIVTALRDDHGELRGFAKVTRDLTERLRAEQNARRLAAEQAAREAAEAAEARLRESEERLRALSSRLEVILESLAEGVAVQDRTGQLIFANRAGALGMGFSSAEACTAATPSELASRFELRDEQGRLLEPAMLPGRRVLAGEPASSMLVDVRDRRTGEQWWRLLKATGVHGEDGRPELAIYIWHDVTERRRRAQHDSYLARGSAALAESLDYNATLQTLAALLVPELGDWCAIHLLEGESLQLVAVSHLDAEKVRFAREVARRYPPDPTKPRGVWSVLRSGVSELHPELSDALLAAYAQDAEHLHILRESGMRSVLIVPIRTRERVLGALSLVSSEGGRRYDVQDQKLAEELGQRAGSSIENARLYAAQKKAREDLALLARAGESLAGASSYEEMLHGVVALTLPALGDFAFFDVVEGDPASGERVRRIAAAYEDPELDALVKESVWVRADPPHKDLCALSSGVTGFEPLIDDAWLRDVAKSPEHLALLQKLRLGSMITVPLRHRGELLGALTVCHGKSGRRHTRDDVKLAEELARRAAVAVTQARLYARAQEAAKSAEEANRLKDEFLATVSHELRTPLNAILGWASLLRTRNTDPALAKPIEVIHRNALAQGKIIEDILDASRIITGKLRLDPKPCDLVAVVRDAIEVLRPSMVAKGLAVTFVPPKEPCMLLADPDRLQQVVWNVLSNAVKFTDGGGAIDLSIERVPGSFVLSVHDTGRGIAPEFLPFVFDRFKQADGSTTRRVGGLGLGLAIVRHLVELHGGDVEVASPGLGRGATFRITLPTRAALASVEGGGLAVALTGATQEREARAGTLSGTRVLVVDDDPDALELLRVVLHEAGAEVETASSAAAALGAIRRFRPAVLVSDIGMPGQDGYALMERVRALSAREGGGTPAIALTAYTGAQDKSRVLAAGFALHLGKPVDTAQLVQAIASLAAHPQP